MTDVFEEAVGKGAICGEGVCDWGFCCMGTVLTFVTGEGATADGGVGGADDEEGGCEGGKAGRP